MNLNNRLNRIEQTLNPAPERRPLRYVVIHPPDECEPTAYERTRPGGYHPKFSSEEAAQAYYPGEELFFIKVVRTRVPLERMQ